MPKIERSGFNEIGLSIVEFGEVLPRLCDSEISSVPRRWIPDNPLCGTCLPVAIVAQRVFGGILMRADLRPYPKFSYMYWHWANLLSNGKLVDFTRSQFGDFYPREMVFVEKDISILKKHPQIIQRAELLFGRMLTAHPIASS